MHQAKIEIDPAQTVLVIGGRGFIGRHIVEQLENFGANVVIGSRATNERLAINTRQVRLHEMNTPKEFDALLKEVDVVINAVGILRQRWGESYKQVHHQAVARLANACAEKKIRLVHVSALGLDNPVQSRFLITKRDGELAIQKSLADWYICRPSLVDGEGGYGAKWFRRLAKWPLHIAPANAAAILAPIHVKDLGEAIAKIALKCDTPVNDQARIYELGGDQRMTVLEYLSLLNNKLARPNVRVPAWLARTVSHFFDLLHLTPFSFGHYELLKFDNVPAGDQTRLLLGRSSRALGSEQQTILSNQNGIGTAH